MRIGQRIWITAPGRDTCHGRVEALTDTTRLPDLPGLDAHQARTILAEWQVSRVAILSYFAAPDRQLLFAALEIAGAWYDLSRQPLTLTPIAPALDLTTQELTICTSDPRPPSTAPQPSNCTTTPASSPPPSTPDPADS